MEKIAFVSGASGNLGQEVVHKFLKQGYSVIGTVKSRDTSVADADRFEKVALNAMNEKEAGDCIESIVEKYKKVDVAVLTVGGFAMGKIADTTSADIYRQYQLNFETAYNLARPLLLQMMKQKGGRIFLVGSRPGLEVKAGKNMIAYSLSKSLLFRLAEIMNEEGKTHNVVTCVIVPATIDTPENRSAMPDADQGSWAEPAEIADIIYFYCTDEAAIIREPLIKVYNNS